MQAARSSSIVRPSIDWRNNNAQRDFLDDLAKKLNVKKPQDWGNVTTQQVRANTDGRRIIGIFCNSLLRTLSNVYPEIKWEKSWFQNIKSGYWTKENKKKFFDNFAKIHQINKPQDWGKAKHDDITRFGGKYVIGTYGNSLIRALRDLYDDIEWKTEWFENVPSVPKGHWKDQINQRRFLDEVARDLNIESPSEWGKVTLTEVISRNGNGLISHNKGSLFRTLVAAYPEVDWDKKWFKNISKVPKGHWTLKENQRTFMDNIARLYNLKNPRDWGRITVDDIKKCEGSSVLEYYDFSLFNALQGVYPEIEWERSWFPRLPKVPKGYWSLIENQKSFMDGIGRLYKINSHSDWGRITLEQIVKGGGTTLLVKNNFSLFNILQQVYPEVKWDRSWFPRLSKYPTNFWNSLENQRNFLDSIANQYHVIQSKDWQRISLSLINNKGGKPLLARYNNSLLLLLKKVYPNNDWNQITDRKSSNLLMSNVQHEVWNFVRKFFPEEKILVNFRHPELLSDKRFVNIELDIWIPELNIAFEYHGHQHFRDAFNKDLVEQRKRDQLRREQCSKVGITLIEIPYWWDNNEESLLATILQSSKQLKNKVHSELMNDPQQVERLLNEPTLAIPKEMKFKDSDFISLPKIWHPRMDPTGWFITEKYDGIRAYWDGKQLYNKRGDVLPAPQWFKKILPPFPLDGELW